MYRIAVLVASCLALMLALPGGAQALEQKLVASGGAAGDRFGTSVAVDGDTAVVGAPKADGRKGAVYVFTRSRDSWTQTAKLTATGGAADDQLGYSVAIDGDTIVAGAPFDDVGTNGNQGSVYTFARTGAAARTETAMLTATVGRADGDLGLSVAVDGDTIVAGAPGEGAAVQGSVYTFARTGGERTETAKLTATDGAADDQLGSSVAIDGDTIVAGAYLDDVGTNTDQGSVYTFARTGAARTQTAKLTASDGATNDLLGISVAIDGDTIVAGALFDDVGTNADQGSASIFFAPASTAPAPAPAPVADTTVPLITNPSIGDSTLFSGQGTKFSFNSSEGGSSKLVFQKRVKGLKLKQGGRLRCLVLTKKRLKELRTLLAKKPAVRRLMGKARKRKLAKLIKKRGCKPFKTIDSITQVVTPGRNEIVFTGRIGGRRLSPGVYRAVLTVRDLAGNLSASRVFQFKVIGR